MEMMWLLSRDYKSNNFWLASKVSLVSESGVPLILLVGEVF